MQQITPKLFQGDMEDALRSCHESNIDVIIYLGQEIPSRLCFNCVPTCIHIPLNDGSNPLPKIRNAVFLMYILSNDNKKILVACRMGVSRSVLFATSIYALQTKTDFKIAYKEIKKRVPQGYPEYHLFNEVEKVTEELRCCL